MNPKEKLEKIFLDAINEFEKETKSEVFILTSSYVKDRINYIGVNGEASISKPFISIKIEL